MRRLPIYFVLDVSESMIGEPIEQVQNGMRDIIQELRSDPYALETAWVSVIAYAGKAQTLTPLSELYKFYPPTIPIGSGTSLGVALDYLMQDIDKNIVRTTHKRKGDWKPIVFLFTDGTPTDDPTKAINRWNEKYRSRNQIVVISIGDNIDPQLFGQLTDQIIRFNPTDKQSYKHFFQWITASIRTTSQSIGDFHEDEVKLAPIDGINLEKVDPNRPEKVDENFAVLAGKCQSTGKMYLIKYAKRLHNMKGLEMFSPMDFKLVGAYPIDEQAYKSLSEGKSSNRKINSMELVGAPTCPCCGNQYGLVTCECGNVFCVGESPVNKCPWCGLEGMLGTAEGGIDISRTRG
ncbi:MAG: VWA domain-containing protein [Muribaculaceae bacterium]|nr:VWA domain-containing protein [Muribaculaceae bacterium]